VVTFAGEQRPSLQFGDIAIRSIELAVQLFQQIVFLLDIGLFLSKMDVCLDVTRDRGESLIRGNLLFGALSLAENALRSFLVVPKIGVGDACFESLQALTVLWRVKDSSARARRAD